MDRLFLYILCLCFIGCLGASPKTVQKAESPFSPEWEGKIREFIQYTDSVFEGKTERLLYAFQAIKKDSLRFISLRTDYYYNPDFELIGGYYYLDSNLVIFENGDGPLVKKIYGSSFKREFFIPTSLVDTTKLIPFQDTIPGYQDGRKGLGEYEFLVRRYQVLENDSLVLVRSGWG